MNLKDIIDSSKKQSIKGIESLKQIIESFEEKLLYRYRFDKGAKVKGTICEKCEYFKNGYCDLLNDKVNKKYTCDKFEKANNEN